MALTDRDTETPVSPRSADHEHFWAPCRPISSYGSTEKPDSGGGRQ